MSETFRRFTVKGWRASVGLSGTDNVVSLIHPDGPLSGGSPELSWHGAPGEWSRSRSFGVDGSLQVTVEQVVTEVLTLLGATPERIADEVFRACLAARYTPDHLMAAISGPSR